jgi:hypothetical protein
MADRGVDEPGRPHVDAEARRAVALGDASMRGAEVPIRRHSSRPLTCTSPLGVAAAMRASSP